MLNYHGCPTILNGGYICNDHAEKSNLRDTRDNDTKTRKVHVDGNINIVLGKNGGYMPSSLGSRSISVDRQ